MSFADSLLLIVFLSFKAGAESNVIQGGGNLQEISSEQSQNNNAIASRFIQNFSSFSSDSSHAAVVAAASAEVQIVRKCLVSVDGDHYFIGHQKSRYCNGHPLAGLGGPFPYPPDRELAQTLGGPSSQGCSESRDCSGSLLANQQTIGTAGHCLQGRSVADFCDQFVFVFNRTGDKTRFSRDEVFGCDGGNGTDTGSSVSQFNMHADQGSQDHAFLHLTRPVPESTARALQVRNTPVVAGENLFAVGHPRGAPRMVSTLQTHSNLGDSGYSYIHSEGYVYPGQSGGPLLDSQGQVVGIMAAVDDKRYGNDQVREPMVRMPGPQRLCKTQSAPGSVITEAIGFAADVRRDMQVVPVPAAGASPTESEQ